MPGYLRTLSSTRFENLSLSSIQDLRVVAANRSFYLTFKVNADDTQGKLLYDLGDGQWDIPKLRLLLGKIVPEQGAMENYEVEHDFPSIGQPG